MIRKLLLSLGLVGASLLSVSAGTASADVNIKPPPYLAPPTCEPRSQVAPGYEWEFIDTSIFHKRGGVTIKTHKFLLQYASNWNPLAVGRYVTCEVRG
ncbi:hypothetical protein N8J89_08470 [Crossiella sp. CA-258035]|uniref:hypothetical protein n=1 Tax=Crossiella sp. CA-258035 TaxID=2981138 RepID=UPI0024BC76B0|nr:hypothetical protein [Crossiella sp. CA-258035]WHT21086.1 hypothetical protein N8J89_08470 [Crossiella sp. CA-258035]